MDFSNGFSTGEMYSEFSLLRSVMSLLRRLIRFSCHRMQLDRWLKFCKNENAASRKDNEKAMQFKEQGNSYFKKKNYPASVNSYTESARYSAGDDVNFAMAIANRSASFFHMCRYNVELHNDVWFTLIIVNT